VRVGPSAAPRGRRIQRRAAAALPVGASRRQGVDRACAPGAGPEPVLPPVHVRRGVEGGAACPEGHSGGLDPRHETRLIATAWFGRAMGGRHGWTCSALLCMLCLNCGAQSQPRGAPASAPPASAAPAGEATGGWHLTVYYTPVESYHGPPLKPI